MLVLYMHVFFYVFFLYLFTLLDFFLCIYPPSLYFQHPFIRPQNIRPNIMLFWSFIFTLNFYFFYLFLQKKFNASICGKNIYIYCCTAYINLYHQPSKIIWAIKKKIFSKKIVFINQKYKTPSNNTYRYTYNVIYTLIKFFGIYFPHQIKIVHFSL